MPPFRIISFGMLLVTLAVNVAMPLFRVYAVEAGLNNGQTSLVFAAYITGMLPCYIFLGGISDKVGRKPILIISVLCSFFATFLLTLFPTLTALVFARVLQGIALALSMGTGTAYLAEVLQHTKNAATKAANLASLSTAIGFSGGALVTTLYLLFAFTLVLPSYYLLLGLTLIGLALLFTLPNPKPIGGSVIRLTSLLVFFQQQLFIGQYQPKVLQFIS